MSSSPPECIPLYKFGGTFACAQIDLRKSRARRACELATLAMTKKKLTMFVGLLLNPMRDRNGRQEPGGKKGRHHL